MRAFTARGAPPSRLDRGGACRRSRAGARAQALVSEPLLLRAARGEAVERPPVWLLRQAGRYMSAFRAYSDKFPFRQRSETVDIAVELSLQPWRAFRPDGVIMFSDILTPLPALGLDFDVVKGVGPVIPTPVRSLAAVQQLHALDLAAVPFVRPVLQALRSEVGSSATVVGFVGTPWTLAAYAVEGGATKDCATVKRLMHHSPEVLHALLAVLADGVGEYAVHQADSGAQVLQLFDSWAHHLSPQQFQEFSLPYAQRVMARVRSSHPHVPLVFHANGSAGKEHLLGGVGADVVGLDWATDLARARALLGPTAVLQGNVDPQVLFGPEGAIRGAVERCVRDGGRHHILNVGHGVCQGTPEASVALFCDLARAARYEGAAAHA